MTEYTYDENIFSDLYKDANGFRPRSHEFYDAAPARKQEIWDGLLEDLDAELKWQKERERVAVADFEALVQKNIDMGAADRKSAIQWLIDAEGEDFWDYGYMEYQYGIPYGTIEKEFA